MKTVCIKTLSPDVALPPTARYFEKQMFTTFRPGVALVPAARYFKKVTFVYAFRPVVALPPAEAGGRLGPGGLGGGAPQRMCLKF